MSPNVTNPLSFLDFFNASYNNNNVYIKRFIAEFSRKIKHTAISYGFCWIFLKLFNHWAQLITETLTGAFPTGAPSTAGNPALGAEPCSLSTVPAALGGANLRRPGRPSPVPPRHCPKHTPAAPVPGGGHSPLGQLRPAQHGATQLLHIAQVHIVEVVSSLEENPPTVVTHPRRGRSRAEGCECARCPHTRPAKARCPSQLNRARGLGCCYPMLCSPKFMLKLDLKYDGIWR